MGEVVNLRQVRKRTARERQAAEAERNRTAFGLSGKLKAAARKEAARSDAKLDGHRLDPKSPATPRSD